jgi:hypothetical protein
MAAGSSEQDKDGSIEPYPSASTTVRRSCVRAQRLSSASSSAAATSSRCGHASELWHWYSQWPRTVLMHTLAILLNVERGTLPLHLAQLVASHNAHSG